MIQIRCRMWGASLAQAGTTIALPA
jgi:hypothetical protein